MGNLRFQSLGNAAGAVAAYPPYFPGFKSQAIDFAMLLAA
jgi:hypothetical protein